MRILFLVIFSIVCGSSIDTLIASLDAIGPGTSDMFYEWGQEEEMLENHYKILVGEIDEPANYGKVSALEFVLTVSYMNPEVSRDELGYLLHQAFQSNKLVEPMSTNSRVAVNRLLNLFNSMTTLRDSVFTRLFTSIGVSARVNMGQPDLEAIAN